MRFQQLSTALATLLAIVPAVSSQAGADPRLAKFHALAARNGGVLPLTSQTYDEIISNNPPRNYSTSIILTALNPKFGCAPCQAFEKEHREVANQWWTKNKKNKVAQQQHFFAVLDFEAGQEIFRRLGLTTAPIGQLFIPGSSEIIPYDFNRQGPSADAFATFIARSTGLPVSYSRPVDNSKLVSAVTMLAVAATSTYMFWSYVRIFLLSRWLWAIACMAFILPMISGYMWNQIRHPPFMQTNQKGQPSYFAGGFSSQFGVETQIISVVYGILAFATYTIVATLPGLSHDKVRQKLGVYLWLGVLVTMASVLVSIFCIKNPGYPYKLLF